jgi:drug/metabolite transporter (DMT)-like permease
MVAVAYLVMGSIGALVTWAPAPPSMLVVLRMGIAAAVLSVLFLRAPTWREMRRPGTPRLLLLMGVLDAFTLLLFFTSLRLTNVAVAMFLIFLSPLWVALLAPVVLRQRTDRVVWPGLAIALGGLALIIVPPALGEELRLSVWGIAAGLLSGMLLAGFMMVVSALRRRGLRSATIVIAEGTLDALILLPLAVWQTWVSGDGLTARDLVAGLLLGTVCTAFTYMLWTEGVGFIPVQHVPILGYLEPLAAPLYAYVLVGEVPSGWTLAGGLLIITAGALVILRGSEGRTAAAGVS